MAEPTRFYQDGHSLRQRAARFSASHKTIAGMLRDAGVPVRRLGRSAAWPGAGEQATALPVREAGVPVRRARRPGRAARLYQDCHSLAQRAARLGVSHATAAVMMRDAGARQPATSRQRGTRGSTH